MLRLFVTICCVDTWDGCETWSFLSCTRNSGQKSHNQGDSGGICNTLGNDNMCDSKQKSSYEHGSDFERLPRYGKKKIRTILRARTAIT